MRNLFKILLLTFAEWLLSLHVVMILMESPDGPGMIIQQRDRKSGCNRNQATLCLD